MSKAIALFVCAVAFMAQPVMATQTPPKPTKLCPNGSKIDTKTNKCEEFIHDM